MMRCELILPRVNLAPRLFTGNKLVHLLRSIRQAWYETLIGNLNRRTAKDFIPIQNVVCPTRHPAFVERLGR